MFFSSTDLNGVSDIKRLGTRFSWRESGTFPFTFSFKPTALVPVRGSYRVRKTRRYKDRSRTLEEVKR